MFGTLCMEPQNIPGASNKSLAQVAFKTNLGSYLELRETFLALLIILGTSIAATLLIFFFEFFSCKSLCIATNQIVHASRYLK